MVILFMCGLWLLLHYNGRVESNFGKDNLDQKLKMFTVWSFIEKFADSDLN